MNKVTLIGRLVRDVEVRYTQSTEPLAVVAFALAVDRPFKKDSDATADFFNCTAFGKRGETIANYVKKGHKIAVNGRIQNDNYTDKSGNKKYLTKIIVEDFEFCENKGESYTQNSQSYTQSANTGYNSESFFSESVTSEEDLPF